MSVTKDLDELVAWMDKRGVDFVEAEFGEDHRLQKVRLSRVPPVPGVAGPGDPWDDSDVLLVGEEPAEIEKDRHQQQANDQYASSE